MQLKVSQGPSLFLQILKIRKDMLKEGVFSRKLVQSSEGRGRYEAFYQ